MNRLAVEDDLSGDTNWDGSFLTCFEFCVIRNAVRMTYMRE